jgi:16S rRNA (guanine527-N7)-methyltransferase
MMTMNKNGEAILQRALGANGYDFSRTLTQQLLSYLELLGRWNEVFNLTSINDLEEQVWLHIIDSLSIGNYLHGSRVIDVGTGAGLPGIPLALTYPDKHFVLLDSNSKKTRFLTQVILELKINNIEVVHARCEDYKTANLFDSILSRAFSSIAVMLEKTRSLAAPAGQFLAMKGLYPQEELAALPPGFELLGVHKLIIKGLAAERHLVCIKRK